MVSPFRQPAVLHNAKQHIEVKSTTGPSHESFHMSDPQMKLCEELSDSREHIFLLLRVFELHTANFGIDIHADPWKLMQAKEKMTKEAGVGL